MTKGSPSLRYSAAEQRRGIELGAFALHDLISSLCYSVARPSACAGAMRFQPTSQAQGALEHRQDGQVFLAAGGALARDDPAQREHPNGLALQYRNLGPPELSLEGAEAI